MPDHNLDFNMAYQKREKLSKNIERKKYFYSH